jgi:hypothetical protein
MRAADLRVDIGMVRTRRIGFLSIEKAALNEVEGRLFFSTASIYLLPSL